MSILLFQERSTAWRRRPWRIRRTDGDEAQQDRCSPHPCATYGVTQAGEMLDSTALGRRSLIRPPWPVAAAMDENRDMPGQAQLSFVRQSLLITRAILLSAR
jgi:hypothetical protein